MIRYKVLTEDWRSCLAPEKFSILYIEGDTITAPNNTLGIMCFKRKKDAEDFKNGQKFYHTRGPFITVRVKPIGRGVVPKEICQYLNDLDFLRFYEGRRSPDMNKVLEGTICYKSVKVLEEVKG